MLLALSLIVIRKDRRFGYINRVRKIMYITTWLILIKIMPQNLSMSNSAIQKIISNKIQRTILFSFYFVGALAFLIAGNAF